MPPLIFRKGLDLKHEVAGVLAESYHSDLIESIKNADFTYSSGRLTAAGRRRGVSPVARRDRGRRREPARQVREEP